MVEGWLCTNSNHPDSLAIFKIFKKTIKDQFEYFKTSGVYVGQQAAKMYDSGLRLSQDLRNSSERDIKK